MSDKEKKFQTVVNNAIQNLKPENYLLWGCPKNVYMKREPNMLSYTLTQQKKYCGSSLDNYYCQTIMFENEKTAIDYISKMTNTIFVLKNIQDLTKLLKFAELASKFNSFRLPNGDTSIMAPIIISKNLIEKINEIFDEKRINELKKVLSLFSIPKDKLPINLKTLNLDTELNILFEDLMRIGFLKNNYKSNNQLNGLNDLLFIISHFYTIEIENEKINIKQIQYSPKKMLNGWKLLEEKGLDFYYEKISESINKLNVKDNIKSKLFEELTYKTSKDIKAIKPFYQNGIKYFNEKDVEEKTLTLYSKRINQTLKNFYEKHDEIIEALLEVQHEPFFFKLLEQELEMFKSMGVNGDIVFFKKLNKKLDKKEEYINLFTKYIPDILEEENIFKKTKIELMEYSYNIADLDESIIKVKGVKNFIIYYSQALKEFIGENIWKINDNKLTVQSYLLVTPKIEEEKLKMDFFNNFLIKDIRNFINVDSEEKLHKWIREVNLSYQLDGIKNNTVSTAKKKI